MSRPRSEAAQENALVEVRSWNGDELLSVEMYSIAIGIAHQLVSFINSDVRESTSYLDAGLRTSLAAAIGRIPAITQSDPMMVPQHFREPLVAETIADIGVLVRPTFSLDSQLR
jgi:hypothetical protein